MIGTTTLMGSTIVVLLGWMALFNLSVDLMPEIQFPTVSVTTLYAGAGPPDLEALLLEAGFAICAE